jgi:hypothetical protein
MDVSMKHFLFTLVFCILCFAVGHTFAEEARSRAALHHFRQQVACPAGPDKGSHVRCHGYVIDHIRPLDCGGLDDPSNMQYQTILAGHAKDRWERNGKSCHHRTHGILPPDVHLSY